MSLSNAGKNTSKPRLLTKPLLTAGNISVRFFDLAASLSFAFTGITGIYQRAVSTTVALTRLLANLGLLKVLISSNQ